MDHYVVEVELDLHNPGEETLDRIMDAITDHHGVVAGAAGGGVTVVATVPAESLRQAVALGLAVAGEHGRPVGVTAWPERVRDVREGWVPIPDLLGVTEAAE